MVNIDGYGRCLPLNLNEMHELEQYFVSRHCNGMDRLTNEAYRDVYEALVVLERLLYPENYTMLYIPYSFPVETYRRLDPLHLSRLIREMRLLMRDIVNGSGSLEARMYEPHIAWLSFYVQSLIHFREGRRCLGFRYCDWSCGICPWFMLIPFLEHVRSRMYTLWPREYEFLQKYGKSEEDWYVVGEKLVVVKSDESYEWRAVPEEWPRCIM